MRFKILPVAFLTIAMPNLVAAQSGNYIAPAPTYNFGKVYYFNQSLSGTELTLKGAGAEAEVLINEQFFVTANYRAGDDSDQFDSKFKFRNWEAGVGTFHLVNQTTTLDLSLLGGQRKGDIEVSDYFSVRLGTRHRLTEALEIGAAYRFYDYNNDALISSESAFELFGKYHFDPNFSFDVKFNSYEVGNMFNVGVAYHF